MMRHATYHHTCTLNLKMEVLTSRIRLIALLIRTAVVLI